MELNEFIDLWSRHCAGLSAEARGRSPLKPVDYLQPAELQPPLTSPSCST